jgi:hypothetical protein
VYSRARGYHACRLALPSRPLRLRLTSKRPVIVLLDARKHVKGCPEPVHMAVLLHLLLSRDRAEFTVDASDAPRETHICRSGAVIHGRNSHLRICFQGLLIFTVVEPAPPKSRVLSAIPYPGIFAATHPAYSSARMPSVAGSEGTFSPMVPDRGLTSTHNRPWPSHLLTPSLSYSAVPDPLAMHVR